jgi:hypothetical protein
VCPTLSTLGLKMTQFLKWVPIETVADKVQNFSNKILKLAKKIFLLHLWYYIVFGAQKIQATADVYKTTVLNVNCISIRGSKTTAAITNDREINALRNMLQTYCYGIHSIHGISYGATGNNCGSYRVSPILVITIIIKKTLSDKLYCIQYLPRSFVIIS